MNDLIRVGGKIQMTTVEIADLTGKRHDHVVRDTKGMLLELYGEKSLPNFGESYTAENGQSYQCYRLPKKEVLVLVSGYSIKLRMKIITRLEELERKVQDPVAALNDPATMRQLLLTYSEKVLDQEKTIERQRPKVIALDRLSTSNGSMCVTDAAKTLQIQPKTLFQWMSADGWIYKRAGGVGSWIAYQRKIQQGVLEHKTTTVTRGDGSEKTTFQVLVTPKGLAVLSEKLSIEENIFA